MWIIPQETNWNNNNVFEEKVIKVVEETAANL